MGESSLKHPWNGTDNAICRVLGVRRFPAIEGWIGPNATTERSARIVTVVAGMVTKT